MDFIETLFNKVTDFLKSQIGVFVGLGLAGVGFILGFFGSCAFLGVALGALGLLVGAYLRNAGTKTPFTALTVTLGVLAVFLGTLIGGFSGESKKSVYLKFNEYASSNKYYEEREIADAELNVKVTLYNDENKISDSLKEKISKKVEKINKKLPESLRGRSW
ncbi:hypothetical protein DYE49_12235 [Treponema rectale]|uniref:Uncharacterized protein n=1 Tax=Treponema rectale TaxID=744512 RepID=A0A840SHM1_9SPIR|nr:hypothetical protein [Treponema rectale]MBB5218911.1 hypothetical protein [Treponema rectale]QOS41174.1 hypothetical protein DYE49_12235 [Treponema rectale]